MTVHPLVEQLLDAPNDATRARWLLTVPLDLLFREQLAIRAALQKSGFQTGIDCLAAETAVLAAIRLKDGRHNQLILFARDLARVRLLEIERSGEAT